MDFYYMSLKTKRLDLNSFHFDSIHENDLEQVGHKALNLARLKRAGFSVPDGAVISTNSTHLLVSHSVETLPEEFKKGLLELFNTFNINNAGVAVRSSAVVEDGTEHSFAGEFETVLNVHSSSEFLTAVYQVAQSAYSKIAQDYLCHAHIQDAKMAILIQTMVHGDISGIAFSESPNEEHRGQIILEAVQGLGDKLASGAVESDHAVVSKADFSLLEHLNSGLLSQENIKEIAQKAIEIQAFFGRPQDIEFTISKGKLWILQSRPITAMTSKQKRKEFDSHTDPTDWWSSHNAQEVLPGVICPLSCSFLDKYVNKAVRYAYQQVWDKDDQFDLFGIFYQRSYINMTTMKIISERVLGTDADDLIDQYLGQKHHNVTIYNPDPFLKKVKIKYLHSLPFIYHTVFKIDSTIDNVNKQIDDFQNYLQTVQWDKLSNEELWVELVNVSKVFELGFANHLLSGAAVGTPIKYLENMITPYSKENAKTDVSTLLSGLNNIVSSELTLNIWDLSQIAKKHHIQIGQQFDPKDQTLPEEWKIAYSKFMEQYGHRCENEWDTRAVSWRQNPAPLLQMIQAYTTLSPEDSPYRMIENTAKKRELLTNSLAEKMGSIKRRLFYYNLDIAQRSMTRREKTKSYGVKSARLLEYPLQEITHRLIKSGFIENPEDLYFLTINEIKSALHSEHQYPYNLKVNERKKEFEANKYLELPENFQGYPTPLSPKPITSENFLKGYSINDKTVTGPARIILDAKQAHELKPGEIMVTQTMDIALTPLYSIASGIVVDIGGMLSHGCIIAREFGLPGIINVKEGTRKIKNGDLLTIEGKTGTVFISSDEKH